MYYDTIKKIRDGDAPFQAYPDELASHIEDQLLPQLEAGGKITDRLLPYFEEEAIARLRANGMTPIVEPDKRADPDLWRWKWAAEAQQQEVHAWQLPAIVRAAVKVLCIASRLRAALDEGNTQLVAAYSMHLVCEAIDGGFTIEHLATKATSDAMLKAKATAYASGAGRAAADYRKARAACAQWAKELWTERPTMLIGDVAAELLKRLKEHRDKLPNLEEFPKLETVKIWLREAAKEGSLTIPPEAQKPGRPKRQ